MRPINCATSCMPPPAAAERATHPIHTNDLDTMRVCLAALLQWDPFACCLSVPQTLRASIFSLPRHIGELSACFLCSFLPFPAPPHGGARAPGRLLVPDMPPRPRRFPLPPPAAFRPVCKFIRLCARPRRRCQSLARCYMGCHWLAGWLAGLPAHLPAYHALLHCTLKRSHSTRCSASSIAASIVLRAAA